MDQLSLFWDQQKIVNVASVPQRSPFRYPGGKTWLVPLVRRWLLSRSPLATDFIEPFCGGGIVSLTVAFEGLADRVTMVELDEQVAAVWSTILGDPAGAERLAGKIATFDLSAEAVRKILDSEIDTESEKAFRTVLANRVKRGGILAPGASLVKYGENGRGLASRWYPETLKKRIMNIISVRDRITFVRGDGIEVIRNQAPRPDAAFFIDPPYTVAARRLYVHWDLDHETLFEVAGTLSGDFLMTYDNDERIHSLAEEHGFQTREVPMKNTHHAKMTELLIGKDLSWID